MTYERKKLKLLTQPLKSNKNIKGYYLRNKKPIAG